MPEGTALYGDNLGDNLLRVSGYSGENGRSEEKRWIMWIPLVHYPQRYPQRKAL